MIIKLNKLKIILIILALILFFNGLFVLYELHYVYALKGDYRITYQDNSDNILGSGELSIFSIKPRINYKMTFPFYFIYSSDEQIHSNGLIRMTSKGVESIQPERTSVEGSSRPLYPQWFEPRRLFEISINHKRNDNIIDCILYPNKTGFIGNVYHDEDIQKQRAPIGILTLVRK